MASAQDSCTCAASSIWLLLKSMSAPIYQEHTHNISSSTSKPASVLEMNLFVCWSTQGGCSVHPSSELEHSDPKILRAVQIFHHLQGCTLPSQPSPPSLLNKQDDLISWKISVTFLLSAKHLDVYFLFFFFFTPLRSNYSHEITHSIMKSAILIKTCSPNLLLNLNQATNAVCSHLNNVFIYRG